MKWLGGENPYNDMLAGIWKAYGATYKGDNLWFEQVKEATSNTLSKFPPDKWGEYYELANHYRRTLNSDMKPLSLLNRIFGGTKFARSHPQPQERVKICERDVLQCLAVLTLAQTRV